MKWAKDIKNPIDRWLIQHVEEMPTRLSTAAMEQFGLTRQAVNRHLQSLVKQRLLTAAGRTRGRHYEIALQAIDRADFEVSPALREDVVWRNQIAPRLVGVSENVGDICHYGFTEIFNNAMEHSKASRVWTLVTCSALHISMRVGDAGVGIFRKIKNDCGLDDDRHAVFELSKGKLTTDPRRHSGEGIFFASRMFDRFLIHSRGLTLIHHSGHADDWLLEEEEGAQTEGTIVSMRIAMDSERTMPQVFDQFAKPEDRTFSRTHVVVDLARYKGEKFVSRSQAKRLIKNFDKFKEIFLDFKGIESIGQGFADEVFRVFTRDHPQIRIVPGNASDAVQWMIDHVASGGGETDFLPGLAPGGGETGEGGDASTAPDTDGVEMYV